MRYESARHDSPAAPFATMDAALKHLDGSCSDSTRPYLRVLVEPDRIQASFLIIGGKKVRTDHPVPPPILCAADQRLLDAWRFIPPDVKHLLDEIDLSNNGYARLDCLDAVSRRAVAEAILAGHIQIGAGPCGSQVVHRPELRMGVITVEKAPDPSPTLGESDWEGAILERQERESLRG